VSAATIPVFTRHPISNAPQRARGLRDDLDQAAPAGRHGPAKGRAARAGARSILAGLRAEHRRARRLPRLRRGSAMIYGRRCGAAGSRRSPVADRTSSGAFDPALSHWRVGQCRSPRA
jgi:hypothetical protein